jgi:lipopolysaccharide/colanic/teichoic acid biosynthesis glycosyltransferase
MDFLFALALLPFATAVFTLLLIPQLAVFGGVFYVSQRVGRGGKKFTYIKLRTMHDAPPAHGGHGRAHLETERIPPWGRFLRKSHFDEIPEIVFILIGAESFAGPRPLLAEHITLVDSPERRALKPGWTGLSQIFLKRRKILPSRIQRRLDRRLAETLNPRLYLKLLFATAVPGLPRKKLSPGPTVRTYRESLLKQKETRHENN